MDIDFKDTAEKTPDNQMVDIFEPKDTNQFILPNLVFKDQKKEHHPNMPVIDEESEDSEDTPRRAIDFEK